MTTATDGPLGETGLDRTIVVTVFPNPFRSGYGDKAIPAGHRDWKMCAKPFKGADLATLIAATLP